MVTTDTRKTALRLGALAGALAANYVTPVITGSHCSSCVWCPDAEPGWPVACCERAFSTSPEGYTFPAYWSCTPGYGGCPHGGACFGS